MHSCLCGTAILACQLSCCRDSTFLSRLMERMMCKSETTGITHWYSRILRDPEYGEEGGGRTDYQEEADGSVVDEERWLADREVA